MQFIIIVIIISTKNKRTSIKELSEREDIIIKKAKKGGAVVIVDEKDYTKEDRQLGSTKNYRKLQEDPTTTNIKLVNDTIARFKKEKLINEKVAN